MSEASILPSINSRPRSRGNALSDGLNDSQAFDESPGRAVKAGRRTGQPVSFSPTALAVTSPGTRRHEAQATEEMMEFSNPFQLPKEDILLYRQKEMAEQNELRERMKSMSIIDKTALTTKPKAMPISRSIPMVQRAATLGLKQERIFRGRRQEKENMADFLAKKRDMFLVQMSLDTKRQEIQALEEKAQMKEEALKKSELMLEEDAMRFDAFLKENDRKAHDAHRKAEEETKKKQEKWAEIKRLNQEISKVENDMSKYEEKLAACLKYKMFLEKLTPPEWLDEQKRKLEAKRKKRRDEEEARHGPGTGSRAASRMSKKDRELTEEDADDSGDEEPMYFTKPEQLLDIFTQLEERNLFLIQNVQDTEQGLEDLKQKYQATARDMDTKTAALEANIQDLQNKIKAEKDKATALQKRTSKTAIASSQQQVLQELQEKVKEVYVRCGFDADSHADKIDMLREIEGWLEYLLSELSQLDPKRVEEAERAKENVRRENVRQQKREEQQREYEERLAKSTARAKAEVIKNTGKPLMFRSPPIRKRVVEEKRNTQADEEAEDIKRFFTA